MLRRVLLALGCAVLGVGVAWLAVREREPAPPPRVARLQRAADEGMTSDPFERAPAPRVSERAAAPNADDATPSDGIATRAAAARVDSASAADASIKSTRLRGRLLDARGRPIEGARVDTTLWSAPAGRDEARSAADGRFELEIASSAWPFAELLLRGQRSVELGARADACLHRRAFALSDDAWGKTTEIGDWTLEDELVLARVRVRDAAGELLDPFDVALDQRIDGAAVSSWPSETRLVRAGEALAELRGLARPARLELRAGRAWSAPAAWTEVAPLGAEVELRLAPGGGARGSVVVDEDLGANRVRVRLCSRERAGMDGPEAALRVPPLDDARGDWVVVGLAPGLWRAQLVGATDGALLAEHELPPVLAGEIAEAGTFDLRGAIRRFELVLRTPGGASIERGLVAHTGLAELERDGADAVWARADVAHGRAILRTRAAPLRVLAWARGYRPASIDLAPVDRVIVLEPGWTASLRVALSGAPPPLEFEWLDAPAPLRGPHTRVELEPSGAAWRVVLPGRGRYQLRAADDRAIGGVFNVPDGGPMDEISIAR